jgi:uncharacterized protein YdaU (DUF1376 family)
MHYYNHNIDEFRSLTINMSREARWIFRDMLDIIYRTEKPLTDDLNKICRDLGVRSEEEKAIVAEILLYEFVQVDGGYMHPRAAEQIAAYHAKADKARVNGKSGGRRKSDPVKAETNTEPKGTDSVPAGFASQPMSNQEPSKSEANKELRTNNQDKTPHTPQGGIVEAAKRTRASRGCALKTFLADCKTKNERPIRDYEPLWNYTRTAGLPDDFVALAWVEFCRRFGAGGVKETKVQIDWRKTFRNYVEGNFLKLWAIGPDGYFLTTQGKQAQVVAEAA